MRLLHIFRKQWGSECWKHEISNHSNLGNFSNSMIARNVPGEEWHSYSHHWLCFSGHFLCCCAVQTHWRQDGFAILDVCFFFVVVVDDDDDDVVVTVVVVGCCCCCCCCCCCMFLLLFYLRFPTSGDWNKSNLVGSHLVMHHTFHGNWTPHFWWQKSWFHLCKMAS